MEFKLSRNILAKTLGNIVKIIPPKSTYTILQNIIIEAKGKNLLIQATDLDIFIKKVIPAEVKEEGKVLIPGKKLLGLRHLHGAAAEPNGQGRTCVAGPGKERCPDAFRGRPHTRSHLGTCETGFIPRRDRETQVTETFNRVRTPGRAGFAGTPLECGPLRFAGTTTTSGRALLEVRN